MMDVAAFFVAIFDYTDNQDDDNDDDSEPDLLKGW